jgi:hypothetical protein
MDVTGITPGEDFVATIRERVGSCTALVAVIGRNWSRPEGPTGVDRLADPDDFIRLEIATALERNILVIPVLINTANLPRKQELPECLAALVRRQAVVIDDARFDEGAARLISALGRVSPAAGIGSTIRPRLRSDQSHPERDLVIIGLTLVQVAGAIAAWIAAIVNEVSDDPPLMIWMMLCLTGPGLGECSRRRRLRLGMLLGFVAPFLPLLAEALLESSTSYSGRFGYSHHEILFAIGGGNVVLTIALAASLLLPQWHAHPWLKPVLRTLLAVGIAFLALVILMQFF